jgi:hypothetical protein
LQAFASRVYHFYSKPGKSVKAYSKQNKTGLDNKIFRHAACGMAIRVRHGSECGMALDAAWFSWERVGLL